MSLASVLLLNIDVQMNLMMGDILHLLDVIWSWISPSEDEENIFRPHGDPQMIRFGAHLVLVLRCLLVEQMKDAFREKIMTVGDLILHIVFKRLWLYNGSALHLPPLLMMLKLLVPNFSFEHCYTATNETLLSLEDHDVFENLREFQDRVSVSISSTDNCCIEVVLRCLATDGDGLGPRELNDGGILATVIAAGFKGELVRFQADVTMEISRLDAWYSSKDGSLEGPATYIVWGLCRRMCIP
ncbi:Nuclear pore complex protein NUP107 [Camellia lanceoleosa]|uniref:Nuclear pore complex protein NUP107 n=1 Tax=Camellia lanceoleosa TaxID=1840588 RepID=A0ACC0II96_9ERIC|nr:Nuclear pore complex protein NUP107 [Camellia lanceoleosa]